MDNRTLIRVLETSERCPAIRRVFLLLCSRHHLAISQRRRSPECLIFNRPFLRGTTEVSLIPVRSSVKDDWPVAWTTTSYGDNTRRQFDIITAPYRKKWIVRALLSCTSWKLILFSIGLFCSRLCSSNLQQKFICRVVAWYFVPHSPALLYFLGVRPKKAL